MDRIAIFSNFLQDAAHDDVVRGGIDRWAINLANGLAAQGLGVDLLVRQPVGTVLQARRLAPSVRLLAIGRHKWWCAIRLAWLQSRHRWQAVIGANHAFNVAVIAASLLRGKRFRVFATVHENVSEAMQRLRPSRQRRYARQLRRWYRHAEAVVGVSSGVVDDLRAHWLDADVRTLCIRNPVVTPAWLAAGNGPCSHPWLDGDHDGHTLLAVGRLEDQKDYPTLLAALAALPPSYRLLVIGDGRRRDALQAQAQELGIAERIDWLGWIADPAPLMAAADRLVLSSRWEGFGNVLVEAMALGTPVVSTDCPSGPAEILANGRYGHLAHVGDSDALAAAIVASVRAPIETAALQRRAAQFSTAAIAQRWLCMLRGDSEALPPLDVQPGASPRSSTVLSTAPTS